MASYVSTDNLKTVVQRIQKAIPGKTSQLENDSKFVTKDEIADVIEGKVLNKQEADTRYASINHNHDNTYAKISSVNSSLNSLGTKISTVNNSFDNYYNKEDSDARYLSKNVADISYAAIDHDHNDVYAKIVNVNKSIATVNANIRDTNDSISDMYTRTEVDEKLADLDVTKLKREIIGVSNTVATISNKVKNVVTVDDLPDVSVYARQTELNSLNDTVKAMYTNAEIDGKIAEIKITGGGDGNLDISLDDFKAAIAGEGYAKESWADAKFATIASTYTKNEVDSAIAAAKNSINSDLANTTSKIDNVIDTVIPTLATKDELKEVVGIDASDFASITDLREVSNKVDDIVNIDLPTFATKEDLEKINPNGVDLTTFATHDEVSAAKADIKLDVTTLETNVNTKINDIVDNTIPTLATKDELKNITVDTSGLATNEALDAVEAKVDDIVNTTIPTLATKDDLQNVTVDTSDLAKQADLAALSDKVTGIVDTTIPTLATKDDLKNVTVDTTDLAKAADLTALSGKVTEITDTTIPTLATKTELEDAINAIPAVEVNKAYVSEAVAEGVKPYLLQTDAANTYLTRNSASSTYLTQGNASTTYLNKTDAADTYLSKADAESLFVTETKITDLRAEVTTASDKASSAKSTAETANTTANAANTTAGEAKTTAEGAVTTANEAKTSAENSAAAVTKCQEDVATALEKVDDIKMKVASVYTAAGSRLFETLPEPSEDNLGYVYNVIDAFTTTDKFVEGEGINTAAGTNVVVVLGADNTYQYDLLSIGSIAPLVATADEVLEAMLADDNGAEEDTSSGVAAE